MRRLWILGVVVATLALAACSQPTAGTSSKGYYIYNSVWSEVSAEQLAILLASKGSTGSRVVGSRELSLSEAQAAVTLYNAETAADQLTLTSTDTPITEAPTVTLYSVSAACDVLQTWPDVDRSYYASHVEAYTIDAAQLGGTLYVGHVPAKPAPVIDPTESLPPAEKWNIYLLAADGSIICSEVAQTKATYLQRVADYQYQAQADGQGEYVVSGAIYTPPTI